MSEFNAVGEGGLNDILIRRLSVSGSAPSPTVEPALFPAIVLENDRPEWGYLKGELRFGAANSVTAGGAGTRASVHLVNTNPASLVVVKLVQIAPASGSILARLIQYGLGVLPTGSAITAVCMDSRVGGRSGSARVIADNTLGLAGTTSFATNLVANTIPGEVVLSPGWALYLVAGDNIAISGYQLQWTERQAEPRELV